MRDLHSALKTQILAKVGAHGAEWAVLRLQYGKDDIVDSLHVRPNTYSSAGLQSTDLLAYADFKRSRCPSLFGECYVREVPAGFSLEAFGSAFAAAYSALRQSEKHLDACGIFLHRPEGGGFFWGQPSAGRRFVSAGGGNGHTAAVNESMEQSDDGVFRYAFSWLKGDREKGWTTHYWPKHPPLTLEIQSALAFLGLKTFDHCPEFDFEPCYWRFTSHEARVESVFSGNAGIAHGYFDSHAEHFSPGVEQLLLADAKMRPFGMEILPEVRLPIERVESKTRHTAPIKPRGSEPANYEYDVAISFAGTERPWAQGLAEAVQTAGYRVFYDEFYPELLWGKDLAVFFAEVYGKKSRYCVIFASEQYAQRAWTTHEYRSAAARAIEEKGAEYILPIRVDDTEIPGLLPTTGYLELARYGIEKIADLLILKVKGR